MKSQLFHYCRVYRAFLSTSFSEAMGFRTHFVLLVGVDFVFYLAALGSVSIIYDHVSMIGPWNREQLMFFMSFMLAIHQLHMAFISDNFWEFSVTLRMGMLDFILLKPISALFTTFLRRIRPGNTINLPVAFAILIYYGIQVELSAGAWTLLPVMLLLGTVLLALIDMTIVCSMFWMLEGTGINFVRIQLQQVAQWPDFVYDVGVRRIMTVVIPILLIANPPVRFLYDYGDWLPLLGMLVAIGVASAALQFIWKLGLRTYESASS